MASLNNLSVGDKVSASYKTGEYVGEIVELTSSMKAAVQILAVLKHPEQGDLHNRMEVNVPFFHQRRALAYREIALMPLSTIQGYEGSIREYRDSLKQALQEQMLMLQQSTEPWAKRSLQELKQLNQEYFPQK